MRKLKELLKVIPFVRDYISFISVYYDGGTIFNFILFRFFPILKKEIYWPVHPSSEVRGNVFVGKGARVGHRPNCIIQGRGKLFIGDYVEVGPNCVIISGNHSLTNQSEVVRKETIIGDYCWIASSCNILAGVVLGPRTVVGAGSVVTKSFPEGYCVIAGNPAKIIKNIPKDEVVIKKPKIEYYGYIRADKFESFASKRFQKLKFSYDISSVSENSFFLK